MSTSESQRLLRGARQRESSFDGLLGCLQIFGGIVVLIGCAVVVLIGLLQILRIF
jgi:hypothetical protein